MVISRPRARSFQARASPSACRTRGEGSVRAVSLSSVALARRHVLNPACGGALTRLSWSRPVVPASVSFASRGARLGWRRPAAILSSRWREPRAGKRHREGEAREAVADRAFDAMPRRRARFRPPGSNSIERTPSSCVHPRIAMGARLELTTCSRQNARRRRQRGAMGVRLVAQELPRPGRRRRRSSLVFVGAAARPKLLPAVSRSPAQERGRARPRASVKKDDFATPTVAPPMLPRRGAGASSLPLRRLAGR